MGRPGDSPTSPTLLWRLRDLQDQEAWNEFVDRYGPKVYAWCKRHSLQDADTEEVTQEVLLRLVKAIRNFVYDPARSGFRAWLKTITTNVICDVATSRARAGQGSGDTSVGRRLEEIPNPEDFGDVVNEIDAEFERDLLRLAMERVRSHPRLESRTFEAFRLTAIDGLGAPAVAERLGMTIRNVYIAKSRVTSMLKDEIKKLMETGPEPHARSAGEETP